MKRRHDIKKIARILKRNRNITNLKQNIISHDFSTVEDGADAFSIIRNLAAHAGRNAAAEAKARGLARVYARNNKLVKLSSKGETVFITPRIKRASFFIKYNPSTILDAVKK